MKDETFFHKIAAKAGIYDIEIAKKLYYGMVKVICADARNTGYCLAPDFGEFAVKRLKDATRLNINTQQIEKMKGAAVLKFKPDYKVKKYIKESLISSDFEADS